MMSKKLEAAFLLNAAVLFGTTLILSEIPLWSEITGLIMCMVLIFYSWKSAGFQKSISHILYFAAGVADIYISIIAIELFSPVSVEIVLDGKVDWFQVVLVLVYWVSSSFLTEQYFHWVTKKEFPDREDILDMPWVLKK